MIPMARQPPHAKTGNGVAGEVFSIRVTEVLGVNLARTQGVETQYLAGLRRVHQYKNRVDPLCILLRRVFLQEIIQGRLTTLKAGAVMQFGAKNLFFKHA